jgi:hypothetical protein
VLDRIEPSPPTISDEDDGRPDVEAMRRLLARRIGEASDGIVRAYIELRAGDLRHPE